MPNTLYYGDNLDVLRTIGELLEGNQFELPMHPSMYQAAQRVRPAEGRQAGFDEAV